MADLRVLVIAPDALARAGLAALLGDRPGYEVAGQVPGSVPAGPTPSDGRRAGTDGTPADVVVWDLGWDMKSHLGHLVELCGAGVPVVALVSDEVSAADALAAGARGVLSRDVDARDLAASVTAVGRGLLVLDPEVTAGAWRLRGRSAGSLAEDLTPRELEVLQLLAEGLSNKGIADRLRVSEHTAKYHVNAIFGKLGAQTRTEAVARAARLGLVLL